MGIVNYGWCLFDFNILVVLGVFRVDDFCLAWVVLYC